MLAGPYVPIIPLGRGPCGGKRRGRTWRRLGFERTGYQEEPETGAEGMSSGVNDHLRPQYPALWPPSLHNSSRRILSHNSPTPELPGSIASLLVMASPPLASHSADLVNAPPLGGGGFVAP